MASTTAWTDDLRRRFEELLREYRTGLRAQLDGLSEEQARRHLVPSKTTLLGLVQHVTYVEAVWFDQAITGRSLEDIGVAPTPDRSFVLARADTTASVIAAHRQQCETSDRNLAGLALEAEVTGRGRHTVWALYVQVLRELAHHSGHADVLREQVLAQGADPGAPTSSTTTT